ncbi:Hok/Gef family protein [Photobacterium indicum]
MPKRHHLIGLSIVCITLLIALTLIRDTLCDVQYKDATTTFSAHLAYEVR